MLPLYRPHGGTFQALSYEPTRNFLVGILTHAAVESDELGEEKMEAEPAARGWEKHREG
jgi:hypothetical protein